MTPKIVLRLLVQQVADVTELMENCTLMKRIVDRLKEVQEAGDIAPNCKYPGGLMKDFEQNRTDVLVTV